MLVLLLMPPEVPPDHPMTVTVEDPSGAFAAALNVSVLACAVVTGLNAAVTPAGRPVTEKLTDPLKPPCGATVRVLAALPPPATITLAGDGTML
jgi:hypothetical protein